MSAATNGLPLQAPPLPDAIVGRLPLQQIAANRNPPRKAVTHLSRTQILDATLQCLRADGYDGTTIRSIAKRLDCAVGSIYRYFRDKRELLDAVCQRRFEPVVQQLEGNTTLEASAAAYARTALDEPEIYRLMFWLASVGRQGAGRCIPRIVDQVIDGWSRLLQSRREAERFWSQLHGGIMLGRHAEAAATTSPAPARNEGADDNPARARRRADQPEPVEDLTLL